MDIETLENKIVKRADANVKARLQAFRNEVDAALSRLFCTCWSRVDHKHIAIIMCARAAYQYKIEIDGQQIRADDHPDSLHVAERDKLRDEIMSTMDTLQRVLMTPDNKTPI